MQAACEQNTSEVGSGLGALKEEYRVSSGTLLINLLLVVAGAVTAICLIYRFLPDVAVRRINVDRALPAGIGVLILCVLCRVSYIYAAPIYRGHGLRVLVFEEGFVCVRDGQATVCRWDDVARVWQDIRKVGRGYMRRIEVFSRHGVKWAFDNRTDLLDNFWNLTDVIENSVARRLLPQALTDIRSGRPWDFGPFGVTREGLEHSDEVLPWHQFKKASCDGLAIRLYRRGSWKAWKTIGTAQVVNLRLLLTLLREFSIEHE